MAGSRTGWLPRVEWDHITSTGSAVLDEWWTPLTKRAAICSSNHVRFPVLGPAPPLKPLDSTRLINLLSALLSSSPSSATCPPDRPQSSSPAPRSVFFIHRLCAVCSQTTGQTLNATKAAGAAPSADSESSVKEFQASVSNPFSRVLVHVQTSANDSFDSSRRALHRSVNHPRL